MILTVPEVAKRFGRTKATVYSWTGRGVKLRSGGVLRLAFVQYPDMRMIDETALERFFAALTKDAGGTPVIEEAEIDDSDFTDADYPERKRGRRKAG